jgi:hypothetical protein
MSAELSFQGYADGTREGSYRQFGLHHLRKMISLKKYYGIGCPERNVYLIIRSKNTAR